MNKIQPEIDELTDAIVIRTKTIAYYFYPKLRRIRAVIRQGTTPSPIGRKTQKEFRRAIVALISAIPITAIGHDAAHPAAAIMQGGKYYGIDVIGPTDSRNILDWSVIITTRSETPLKEAIVSVAPFVLEALAGLYLIRQGLKKRSPVRFGMGATIFTFSLAPPIEVALGSRNDLILFAEKAKESAIQYLGANTDAANIVSQISDPALALITAALVFGTAFYGTKYVSNIELRYLPRDLRNKLKKVLTKIYEKDPKLHRAIVDNFFSKKAKSWARIIIEKLPGLKRTL